jgi:lipoprotein-anchoring transpeptidase ErfK/SrfK
MPAADFTSVRRFMILMLPIAGLIALIGLTGQAASGRIATNEPFAVAYRALPRIAVAQAAAPVRPLRFTIVDSAGATVRRWPGGPAVGTMATTSPLGAHSWSWALSTTRNHRWARIVLPWRPNGQSGWISLAGRTVTRTAIWVKADLSRRTVTLMKGRGPLVVFKSAIGAPSTPTPTGRFSVTDLVATGDPYGPFGWYAFGLSGHQPNLPAGWSGGDQLAIHGTNNPASIGTAASAGCLRVSAAALGTLKRFLRLGTPVVIQP